MEKDKNKFVDDGSYWEFTTTKAGFDPNQPRNEDGEWGSGGGKITVYRGRGRNYREGENEGFLWVATNRETALNYAELDDDGNPMIEDLEIDTPKNPFKLPYKNQNQYVTSENVGNLFRRELYKKVKSKEITIDDYRRISDKIKNYVEVAGDKVERVHTLLNKPSVSKLTSDILKELGFDAMEIDEGDGATYGLLKRRSKAGFDPDQPRSDNGQWGSGTVDKKPDHFLGYHSSKHKIKEISKGETLDSSIYSDLIRNTYIDHGGVYTEDVDEMAEWFENEGYSFTFVSNDIIEGSAFQSSAYKYGDYLYKVYGNGWPHDIEINDPNELGATIIMSKKPLRFELQNDKDGK